MPVNVEKKQPTQPNLPTAQPAAPAAPAPAPAPVPQSPGVSNTAKAVEALGSALSEALATTRETDAQRVIGYRPGGVDESALGPAPEPETTPPETHVEPGTSAPPAEVQDDFFNPQIVAEAESLGISEQELRGLGSPAAAIRTLLIANRLKANVTGPVQAPVAEPQPEPAAPVTPGDFKIDLEDVAPEIRDTFTGLQKHFEKKVSSLEKARQAEVTALQQQLREVYTHVQQLTQSTVEREFNYIVDALDDPDGLFGKGFQVSEAQRKNRERLREEAATIAAGEWFRSGKKATPPLNLTLVERARNMAFANQIAKKARAEVAQQARNAAGQFIAPPTGRNGELPKTGMQSATETFRAGLAKITGARSMG